MEGVAFPTDVLGVLQTVASGGQEEDVERNKKQQVESLNKSNGSGSTTNEAKSSGYLLINTFSGKR
jgi:hypothetical protein